jgi:hypothetical protein
MEAKEPQDPILHEMDPIDREVCGQEQAAQIETQESDEAQPCGQGESALGPADVTEKKNEAHDCCEEQEYSLKAPQVSLLEPVEESSCLIQGQKKQGRVAEDPLP